MNRADSPAPQAHKATPPVPGRVASVTYDDVAGWARGRAPTRRTATRPHTMGKKDRRPKPAEAAAPALPEEHAMEQPSPKFGQALASNGAHIRASRCPHSVR